MKKATHLHHIGMKLFDSIILSCEIHLKLYSKTSYFNGKNVNTNKLN